MLSLLRKLRWSITQRGILGTIKAAPAALARASTPAPQHRFDLRCGTDTGGLIGGADLATGHPHDPYITAYAGVPPSRFEAALTRWRATLSNENVEDFTFIDLGCGKGRALLLASRLPFREVIGIELNPELAATATRNAVLWQKLGEARCPIRVEVGDATAPHLPHSPTLLFLYNPFAEPLVRRLAETVAASNRTHALDVIYQNAYHVDAFNRTQRFSVVWRAQLPLSAEEQEGNQVGSPDDITVQLRLDVKGKVRV